MYHSVSFHIIYLMYFSAYLDMENNCQRMQIVGAVPVTFGWYSTSVVGTLNMTAASRICRLLSFNTEIHEAIASIEACFSPWDFKKNNNEKKKRCKIPSEVIQAGLETAPALHQGVCCRKRSGGWLQETERDCLIRRHTFVYIYNIVYILYICVIEGIYIFSINLSSNI